MLNVHPCSRCDVCLEPFAEQEPATPCAIECGHIFCIGCLGQLTKSVCPLCRNDISLQMYIKLRLDFDPSDAESVEIGAEREARALQTQIARLANQGTTESVLREFIAKARGFLAQQPRHMFSELRVSLRMLGYMCDTKTRLRQQDKKVENLEQTLQQAQKLEKERQSESETRVAHLGAALSMARDEIKMLKQHLTEAQNYASGLMSFLTTLLQEEDKLKRNVASFRAGKLVFPPAPASCIPPDPISSANASSRRVATDILSAALFQDHPSSTLQSFPVTGDEDYLISPLPGLELDLPHFSDVQPDLQDEDKALLLGVSNDRECDVIGRIEEAEEEEEAPTKVEKDFDPEDAGLMSDTGEEPAIRAPLEVKCGKPGCPFSCGCGPSPLADFDGSPRPKSHNEDEGGALGLKFGMLSMTAPHSTSASASIRPPKMAHRSDSEGSAGSSSHGASSRSRSGTTISSHSTAIPYMQNRLHDLLNDTTSASPKPRTEHEYRPAVAHASTAAQQTLEMLHRREKNAKSTSPSPSSYQSQHQAHQLHSSSSHQSVNSSEKRRSREGPELTRRQSSSRLPTSTSRQQSQPIPIMSSSSRDYHGNGSYESRNSVSSSYTQHGRPTSYSSSIGSSKGKAIMQSLSPYPAHGSVHT